MIHDSLQKKKTNRFLGTWRTVKTDLCILQSRNIQRIMDDNGGGGDGGNGDGDGGGNGGVDSM